MTDTTHYERLADLVSAVEGVMHPAVLQGNLAGHLCAGQRWTKAQFIMQSAMVLDSKVTPDAAGQQEFMWLYDSTLASLEAEDMPFTPWLPDQDQTLDVRLDALIQWVNAFLSGFGASGQDFSRIDEDTQEILSDLAAIGQAAWDADDGGNEEDWETVLEHVRLSAIHLFLAYNEPPKSPQSQTTTH